jgi:hypothetical protein
MFRKGLDPVDIHASISALSFFNVSNRHTFGLIFKLDMLSKAYIAHPPRQRGGDGGAVRARLSRRTAAFAPRGKP